MKNALQKTLCLCAVLFVAGIFRAGAPLWDDGNQQHPDERFLFQVVTKLGVPDSFAEYLDEARSPLNPLNQGVAHFAYGTLPTTLLRLCVAYFVPANSVELVVLARTLSACAELLTVLLVFFLGCQLANFRVGCFAAALYACMPLAIQHARFFVSDPFCVLFVTAALTATARFLKTKNPLWLLLAGCMSGAALGCKLHILPLVPLIASLAPLDALRRRKRVATTVLFSIGGLVCCLLTWRLSAPEAFSGLGFSTRWLQNLSNTASLIATGAVDFPPGFQWADRATYWFPLYNMILWGLGLPVGIAALFGIGRALFTFWKQRHPENWSSIHFVLLLLTLWCLGMIVFVSGKFVTSLRYYYPLYPALAVLAAWGLQCFPRAVRWATLLLATVWGIGFYHIYTQPHSRVAASDWIEKNIPPHATISHEYWDDRLPLRPRDKTKYPPSRFVEMRWTDEDTPEKLDAAIQWLEKTDYIILSSDRGRLPIPRLSIRFPMTTRYYETLLDGRLGFEHVATFEVLPRIFGWKLNTPEWAEEAFSVYDHPRARIFRKTEHFDPANARALLEPEDWNAVVHIPANAWKEAPTGLRLPKERWEQQLAGGTWGDVFYASHRNPAKLALAWAALLVALGILTWPMLFVFGLKDHLSLSRVVGLLLTAWAWWFASSTGTLNSAKWLWITLAAYIILSAFLWWKNRLGLGAWISNHSREILSAECLFWGCFLACLLLRAWNPDLWHPSYGGEKPMELTYFTAIARAESFPPYNPWFAGGFINYYYFGFVPPALLTRLTGAPPEVAFQLALATCFALTATGVYAIVRSLSPSRWTAGFAVVLTLLVGSWNQFRLLFQSSFYQGEWFWSASRGFRFEKGELPPITEFPYFTFLFGDLHPHLLSIPFVLLIVALGAVLIRNPDWRLFVLAGLTLGAVSATNTWDLPAAMVILTIAACISLWKNKLPLQRLLHWGCLTLFCKWISFLPFHHWFASGYGGVNVWNGSRTPFLDHALHYGTLLGILILGLAFLAVSTPRERCPKPLLFVYGSAALMVFLLGLIFHSGATMTLVTVGSFLAVCVWGHRKDPFRLYALLLGGLALGLTLPPEWLTLAGDQGRMNMVFKFHFQSWILLAIFTSVIFAEAVSAFPKKRKIILSAAFVLTVPGLFYPITATRERLKQRFETKAGFTLNGAAFLKDSEYLSHGNKTLRLRHDRAVIDWLRKNARGTPVIAEAQTRRGTYDWNSRISMFTGLPTPIGWAHHLTQQRRLLPKTEARQRVADMKELYHTADVFKKLEILQKYDIRYIVVTHSERAMGTREGLAAFDTMPELKKVFEKSAARIYKVKEFP